MNKALSRALLRSKAMEISRCHVQRYCMVCGHRLLKKTSRGNLETNYNCAIFSVELRTCFEIDTSNDTADFPANFCKSCSQGSNQEDSIQVYGKAIRLVCRKIKIFTWPHKFNHRYITHIQEPIHSWIQLKEAQKPGQQPGITPKALLCYVNTIAPPKVVCHRKELLLAPIQALSVMDLLTCPICKGMLLQSLKLHWNVQFVCTKWIAHSIITSVKFKKEPTVARKSWKGPWGGDQSPGKRRETNDSN